MWEREQDKRYGRKGDGHGHGNGNGDRKGEEGDGDRKGGEIGISHTSHGFFPFDACVEKLIDG